MNQQDFQELIPKSIDQNSRALFGHFPSPGYLHPIMKTFSELKTP
jgi:hypothetical protein